MPDTCCLPRLLGVGDLTLKRRPPLACSATPCTRFTALMAANGRAGSIWRGMLKGAASCGASSGRSVPNRHPGRGPRLHQGPRRVASGSAWGPSPSSRLGSSRRSSSSSQRLRRQQRRQCTSGHFRSSCLQAGARECLLAIAAAATACRTALLAAAARWAQDWGAWGCRTRSAFSLWNPRQFRTRHLLRPLQLSRSVRPSRRMAPHLSSHRGNSSGSSRLLCCCRQPRCSGVWACVLRTAAAAACLSTQRLPTLRQPAPAAAGWGCLCSPALSQL